MSDDEIEARGASNASTRSMPRPIVTPEPYSGDGSYTDWNDHFESVAAVNGWDQETLDESLPMRCAHPAFKRLPDATKSDYRRASEALGERFENTSHK